MAEYNFLNDITKFGNNALSAANTLQRQVRSWVTEQVEYLIKSMDLVTEEEFIAKISVLEARIAELEGAKHSHGNPAATKAPKAAAPKAAVKKAPVVKKAAPKKAAVKKPAAKKAATKKA